MPLADRSSKTRCECVYLFERTKANERIEMHQKFVKREFYSSFYDLGSSESTFVPISSFSSHYSFQNVLPQSADTVLRYCRKRSGSGLSSHSFRRRSVAMEKQYFHCTLAHTEFERETRRHKRNREGEKKKKKRTRRKKAINQFYGNKSRPKIENRLPLAQSERPHSPIFQITKFLRFF